MNELLRSGRPWKGPNLDTDFDFLVRQARTYHSYPFRHCERRRDAGGGPGIQRPAGG